MNENKRSIYDIDPNMGESPVAKAVREANQLPDNERLKALSKLAKEITVSYTHLTLPTKA